jgi:hypothetical protein
LEYFEKAPSPLRHEVLPQDIPEPPKVIDPHHTVLEWGWDYGAGTDQFYPVDVNYTHPFDDDDHSWMLDQFTPEELEQSHSSIGFDSNKPDVTWKDSHREPDLVATAWSEGDGEWNSFEPDCELLTPRFSTIPHTGLSMNDEQMLEKRIVMVKQEFRRVTNEDPLGKSPQRSMPLPSNDLVIHLQELSIIDKPATS